MHDVNAVISAIATHIPRGRLTNEELSARPGGWPVEQIYEKTGIRCRPIAEPGECASDLAHSAALRLIESKRLDPESIDAVLFCTQSPDYVLPPSACILQHRLGLPRRILALDYNLGCSGYVAGLALAKGLVESRQARRVLLLTGDTYSKFIHPEDRSVCTLFGDGASATVVSAEQSTDRGVGATVFGTDGRGAPQLIVPAGGARCPRSPETALVVKDSDGNERSSDNLYMNGREVFRFAITTVPTCVEELMAKAGWDRDSTDFLVLHQANKFMVSELTRKLGWPADKVPLYVENLGNTVSSTIPFLLEKMIEEGEVVPGTRLLLVGFGVGYSWAGAAVTW
ncbi:MAG: 3-oxoacyl-ACP synthase III family protein [Armatimonadaceae bacterium]|jgi:3-oxoacyl-[acyl-carrier-protein] synthase-3